MASTHFHIGQQGVGTFDLSESLTAEGKNALNCADRRRETAGSTAEQLEEIAGRELNNRSAVGLGMGWQIQLAWLNYDSRRRLLPKAATVNA